MDVREEKGIDKTRDNACLAILILTLVLTLFLQSEKLSRSLMQTRAVQQAQDLSAITQSAVQNSEELIRFHVLANSDSEEDQALKRAVRDAILEELSPQLAASHSLAESREILTGLRPEMEEIGRKVSAAWGKNYSVKTEYGQFIFPTKSYGSIILPAGEYEAVRVVIGEGKGSNWWCVLFPPLCFVDIEHSTAVQVDGKPGIPIDKNNSFKAANDKPVTENQDKDKDTIAAATGSVSAKAAGAKAAGTESEEKPKVRFWLLEVLSKLF
jgi:stage II sporulation protein R